MMLAWVNYPTFHVGSLIVGFFLTGFWIYRLINWLWRHESFSYHLDQLMLSHLLPVHSQHEWTPTRSRDRLWTSLVRLILSNSALRLRFVFWRRFLHIYCTSLCNPTKCRSLDPQEVVPRQPKDGSSSCYGHEDSQEQGWALKFKFESKYFVSIIFSGEESFSYRDLLLRWLILESGS